MKGIKQWTMRPNSFPGGVWGKLKNTSSCGFQGVVTKFFLQLVSQVCCDTNCTNRCNLLVATMTATKALHDILISRHVTLTNVHIQLFQLTLSDQSLKLKDIFKRLPPHPFDILTFRSSKWLPIVYLQWTDEAWLIFINLFIRKSTESWGLVL